MRTQVRNELVKLIRGIVLIGWVIVGPATFITIKIQILSHRYIVTGNLIALNIVARCD